MNTHPLPTQFLGQAVAALSALTGKPVSWHSPNRLRIGSHTFLASTQPLDRIYPEVILICPPLSPFQATALQAQGQPYLDAAGNACVRAADFYLFIQGQVLPTPVAPPAPAPVGLRLLYYLLSEPDLHQASYRQISQRVGVALGSVSTFFSELRQQGLLREGSLHRWLHTEALLARWVQDYATQLRPTLGAQRYRWATAPGMRWRQLPMVTGSYWSGEPAARLLLQDGSSPTSFTLYSPSLPVWGLVPDPASGTVEVLAPPFPIPKLAGSGGLAHPLLVYTDLLLSSKASDRELALCIRERWACCTRE
ncbi:type IV toxin-antitoxin system AbiEi family antitoxin [Hymenobacter cheonanensis]|uniref:type IV toxin-antitoxin system AbiEi family antitoxin n=1 Tax=Hymenobacter sp. CA2-7 TaxID=3063993 RepID=UPI0035106EC5